ncbi:UNVERIFIED_CONTAM: hypothetical protein Slati_0004700 [Sesamum latifolium]|uniref:Uncharacterized protein n=1 Tax=Sesamum latifolium TaxID=2727402 RepID=A0AAW2Y5S9_9LAMI
MEQVKPHLVNSSIQWDNPPPHKQAPLNGEVLTPREQGRLPPRGESPPRCPTLRNDDIINARSLDGSDPLCIHVSECTSNGSIYSSSPHNPAPSPLAKVENYPRLLRRRSRGRKR